MYNIRFHHMTFTARTDPVAGHAFQGCRVNGYTRLVCYKDNRICYIPLTTWLVW